MRKSFMPSGVPARSVGCQIQTIRYYEDIGLQPAAGRTARGQRRYGETHRQKLVFIRRARELGFPLPAVRELLTLADQRESECAQADRVARRHRESVNRRVAMRDSLRAELELMLTHGHGNRIRDCRVIATLADRRLCAEVHHAEASGS